MNKIMYIQAALMLLGFICMLLEAAGIFDRLREKRKKKKEKKMDTECVIGSEGFVIKEKSYVSLTEEEAWALKTYLECSFIPFIQDKNNKVDDLSFVRLIVAVWDKCQHSKEAGKNG